MNVQNVYENQIDAEKKRFFCYFCHLSSFADRQSLLTHYLSKKHLKNVAAATN
jgi:hypothetical protein